MPTYKTDFESWKSFINGQWIIFDADAIISILGFEQEYILGELRELNAGFVYINPVLLELMNTNDAKNKLKRSKILIEYEFLELPLKDSEIKLAAQIQRSLPLTCQPSPTDLYLGGTLAKHHEENRLLLTANIKDFPSPLYTRKGHILLQNEKSIKTLSFLCIDKTKLVEL